MPGLPTKVLRGFSRTLPLPGMVDITFLFLAYCAIVTPLQVRLGVREAVLECLAVPCATEVLGNQSNGIKNS